MLASKGDNISFVAFPKKAVLGRDVRGVCLGFGSLPPVA